jgi:hypothetical protein
MMWEEPKYCFCCGGPFVRDGVVTKGHAFKWPPNSEDPTNPPMFSCSYRSNGKEWIPFRPKDQTRLSMPAKGKGKKAEADTLVNEIRQWVKHGGMPSKLAMLLEQMAVESVKDYDWASPEEKPLYVAKHLAELAGEINQRAFDFLRTELNGAYGERLRATYARAEATAARHLAEDEETPLLPDADESKDGPNPEDEEHGEPEDDGSGPGGVPGSGAASPVSVLRPEGGEVESVPGLLRLASPEDAPEDGGPASGEAPGTHAPRNPQARLDSFGDVPGDSAG